MHRFDRFIKLICIGLVLLAVSVLPFSCGRKPMGKVGVPVIIITLDTLRSDHLPDYGYTKVSTPAISQFRKDAVLFQRAYSNTPLTLSSHASMMTGLQAHNHGIRDNTGYVLDESYKTLAERMKGEGYQTGAVVSSMVLRQVTGIAQGFDFYNDDLKRNEGMIRNFAQRRGDASVNLARQWLNGMGSDPIFFWLHLYDPHTPYTPPQPFEPTYEGEIAYTDKLVGDFLKHLKEKGLYDDALIILTSDHGEGLGDHGEEEHGMLLYRESIQVPLFIKYPQNQQAGKTIEKPVGLIDLFATVESALGMSVSETDGVPITHSSAIPADRSLFAETLYPRIHYGWHAQKSVIRKQLHLIEGKDTEVYDVIDDPAEKTNLFGKVKVPNPMFNLLEEVGEGVANREEISEEDRAMLESLGYTGQFNFGEGVKDLDFQELMSLQDELSKAQKALNAKEYEKVEADMLALTKSFPALQEAKTLLSMALTAQEKYEQAEHVIMQALVSVPQDYSLLTSLAGVKIELGKIDDALTVAHKAIDLEASYAAPTLVPQFYDKGRFADAEALTLKAFNKGNEFTYGHYVIGRTSMMKGKINEAIEHLTLASNQFSPEKEKESKVLISTLVFLAQCKALMGKFDEGLSILDRALALDPNIAETIAIKADLLLRNNKVGLAERILAEGLKEHPDNAELLMAQTRVKLALSKHKDALAMAERALKANLKITVGQVCFAYLQRSRPEDARKVAKIAEKLDPEQPYSYYVLGRLAHGSGLYDEAKGHLNKALERLKSYPDRNLYGEILYYLGDSEASLGDPNKALPYFEKAVELQPRSPRYQMTLVTFFSRLGEKDRALGIADRWLKQFPSKNNFGIASQTLKSLGYVEQAAIYQNQAQNAAE